MHAGARAGGAGLDNDESAVDLLPPVHSGGILLPDEAALGEADTVEFGGIALKPEQVPDLRPPLADAEHGRVALEACQQVVGPRLDVSRPTGPAKNVSIRSARCGPKTACPPATARTALTT